jgi:hypothetical protein
VIGEDTAERLDVIPAQYRVMVTHFAINPLADRAEISKRGRFRHSQNCESMKPSTVPRVPITPIHVSVSRLGAVSPNTGEALAFEVIAAVVVGGTSLSDGRGGCCAGSSG